MHQPLSPDWGALLFGSFLKAILPWLLLPALIVVIQALFYRWRLHRLSQSGIGDIDLMTGHQFEMYLEALFTKLGYQVERTRYVGDYGADLVVRKDGIKTVVQAKRHKGRVGVNAIGEILRARGNYGCQEAMIVTNSSFTRQASDEARTHGIVLWDRDDLVHNLLFVKARQANGAESGEARIPHEQGNGQRAHASLPANPPVLDMRGSDAWPHGTPMGAYTATCTVCGKEVSEKVYQFCRDHSERFGGQIYCFEHQRRR